MNVRELREALADLPDDLMVVVRGYEDGVDHVDRFERYDVVLNVNDQWYYGAHAKAGEWGTEGKPTVPVVELVGGSDE